MFPEGSYINISTLHNKVKDMWLKETYYYNPHVSIYWTCTGYLCKFTMYRYVWQNLYSFLFYLACFTDLLVDH